MVINLIVFTFFFSVNDSIITFNRGHIKPLIHDDTSLVLLYSGKIEDYEMGHYFYPAFLIREINIIKKRRKILVELKTREKRTPLFIKSSIIFKKPEKPFYIKLLNASKQDIKTLLQNTGLKYAWLDSLKERDYTICGVYTETTLKEELFKYGRKKANKITQR